MLRVAGIRGAPGELSQGLSACLAAPRGPWTSIGVRAFDCSTKLPAQLADRASLPITLIVVSFALSPPELPRIAVNQIRWNLISRTCHGPPTRRSAADLTETATPTMLVVR